MKRVVRRIRDTFQKRDISFSLPASEESRLEEGMFRRGSEIVKKVVQFHSPYT